MRKDSYPVDFADVPDLRERCGIFVDGDYLCIEGSYDSKWTRWCASQKFENEIGEAQSLQNRTRERITKDKWQKGKLKGRMCNEAPHVSKAHGEMQRNPILEVLLTDPAWHCG